MPVSVTDRDLIARIRAGEARAWQECIARYEGRLQAFVISRLRDRALAEDLVQDVFVGFLTALPNYRDDTPVESFLFAITAHKITDTLRRNGRRPALPLNADLSEQGNETAGSARKASSIARSRESKGSEEQLIADCLTELIAQWRDRSEFERMQCVELLFVRGATNKQAAQTLGISEQAVANHKFFVVGKLKDAVTAAGRSDIDLGLFGIHDAAP